MAKDVYVDEIECTGCELCVDTLPDVFETTEDGLSHVYNSEGASEDSIQEVIDNCPAECIHWS